MLFKLYLITVFSIIGIFHIYWAFGGIIGLKASIPENEYGPLFKAEFGGTFLIAFIFILGSIFIVLDIMDYNLFFLQKYLYHFIAFIFFFRAIGEFKYVGFFKKIKNTKFAKYDYFFYSPLCLSVSITSVIILTGK